MRDAGHEWLKWSACHACLQRVGELLNMAEVALDLPYSPQVSERLHRLRTLREALEAVANEPLL